jgi:hypothetical protein
MFAFSYTAQNMKVCTSGLLGLQAVLVSEGQDCNIQIMACVSAIAAQLYYCNIVTIIISGF